MHCELTRTSSRARGGVSDSLHPYVFYINRIANAEDQLSVEVRAYSSEGTLSMHTVRCECLSMAALILALQSMHVYFRSARRVEPKLRRQVCELVQEVASVSTNMVPMHVNPKFGQALKGTPGCINLVGISLALHSPREVQEAHRESNK